MKKHHLRLWLLLATAFVFFAVLSAVELPEVFGYTPRKADFSVLTASVDEPSLPTDSVTDNGATEQAVSAFPVPVDTTAQTILFIGDSMLEGLSPRLAAYAKENGHTLYSVIWYSSTSQVWGRSDKLRNYIESIKPTFIFVSLGANELFVNDIINKRRQYVRKIIADIDTIPYVWIGPPNWKDDTGINTLIDEETAPGTFFVSNGMHFERSRDGAHPTRSSAIEWMDSVARWMPQHCAHPILMDTPAAATGRPQRIFVHQPNEE